MFIYCTLNSCGIIRDGQGTFRNRWQRGVTTRAIYCSGSHTIDIYNLRDPQIASHLDALSISGTNTEREATTVRNHLGSAYTCIPMTKNAGDCGPAACLRQFIVEATRNGQIGVLSTQTLSDLSLECSAPLNVPAVQPSTPRLPTLQSSGYMNLRLLK